MKRIQLSLCMVGLLTLLAAPAAAQYDNSPQKSLVLPECIWAAATGGGTWVTELQITAYSPGTTVEMIYQYGGGYRAVLSVWTSSASLHYQSVKFSNILSTLQSLDPTFTYYGTVGSLEIFSQDTSHTIQAQARTVNGNYGKTFQALAFVDGNAANVGRPMMIMNLAQNATYRTFVGFFNATLGSSGPMTVQFAVLNGDNSGLGSIFYKTFAPWEFMSFNPFVEAGVGSGPYDDCWLWINPTSSGNTAAGSCGLFCFGSSANNSTNDTSSHIAVHTWVP